MKEVPPTKVLARFKDMVAAAETLGPFKTRFAPDAPTMTALMCKGLPVVVDWVALNTLLPVIPKVKVLRPTPSLMLPEPELLACAVMPPQVIFSPRVKDEAAADPKIATSTPLTHASANGPLIAVPQRFNVVVSQVPLPLAVLPFADQNRLAADAEGAVKWASHATKKAAVMGAWERNGVELRGFMR